MGLSELRAQYKAAGIAMPTFDYVVKNKSQYVGDYNFELHTSVGTFYQRADSVANAKAYWLEWYLARQLKSKAQDSVCPVCGSALVLDKLGFLRCDNYICPEYDVTSRTQRAKDSTFLTAFVTALLAWYEQRQAQEEVERNQASGYNLMNYRPRPKAF